MNKTTLHNDGIKYFGFDGLLDKSIVFKLFCS